MKQLPRLNYPKLQLPPSPERIAFTTVNTIIRNDPILQAVINTFIDNSGTSLDDSEPNLSLMPWLRITPTPVPSEFESENQVKGDMLLQTELAIAGTDVYELLDLYGAMRTAIKYSTNSEAFNAAGIIIPLFYLPALQFRKDDKSGQKFLYSVGAMSIRMRINF